MGVWLLTSGAVLIFAALLFCWRFLPKQIKWVDARAPIFTKEQTTLVVTVPDSVRYHVTILLYRREPGLMVGTVARNMADGHQSGSAVQPLLRCAVSENQMPVALDGISSYGCSHNDAYAMIGSFNGEAGHTYTVSVTVAQPAYSLDKMTPCLEVQYDRAVAKDNVVESAVIILPTALLMLIGSVLAIVGGLLMHHATGG